MTEHYKALVETAQRLGLPRSFPADLTTHDRAFCERHDASHPFVWAIGEGGTFIISPSRRGDRSDSHMLATTVAQMFPYMFVWNGVSLSPLTRDELVQLFYRCRR